MFWKKNAPPETIVFNMTVSLSCDPSTRVHDISGDVPLEPNETIEDAQDKIIEQYLSQAGIRNARPVQILHFSYT